jgi:dTDP-4-amino-4,6-dideoxygalactose transaminase
VGTIGNASCLSYFPSKVLGCYGDGGMVITNEETVANTVRMIANHGSQKKYYHDTHGINSRLDSIQAAILNVKLKHIDDWIAKRQENAKIYNSLLDQNCVTLLNYGKLNGNCYNYYTIRTKKRSQLHNALIAEGIQSAVYYPLSLHQQPVFKELKQFGLLNSEKAQGEVLSLPMYPEIKKEEIERICAIINKTA